jgi:hypothetical protein
MASHPPNPAYGDDPAGCAPSRPLSSPLCLSLCLFARAERCFRRACASLRT